jgi:hypothetical protein
MTVRGPKREYSDGGYIGRVSIAKAKTTGTLVGVYASDQAGMERDPEYPWSTVCEPHGSIVCHGTLALARQSAPDPTGWCDDCRDAAEAAANRDRVAWRTP